MLANLDQTQPTRPVAIPSKGRRPGITAVALITGVGLFLGLLFLHIPLLAACGIAFLTSGGLLIGNTLLRQSSSPQASAWEQAFLGQATGLVGLVLLILSLI